MPNFLSIDKLRLDKEWLGQAELYYEYAKKAEDARLEYDQAKAALDLVEAEVNHAIRTEPTKYGLPEKPTESAIKALVPKRPRFVEAQKLMFEAKHEAGVLAAAVVALEHRKRALTMLVELHGRNYFSNPAMTSSEHLRDAARESSKVETRAKGRFRPDDDDDKET
jgi:hypothetical protein